MPAFDLRFITSPEDMPACLLSFDARTSSGDVRTAAGVVVDVVNRAPSSLRRFQNGDSVHTWWNAVVEGAAIAADPSAFGGAGGLVLTTASDLSPTTLAPLPGVVAGEYTLVFIVDGTFTGVQPKLVFYDGLLQVKLNNGAGNVSWSDIGGGGSGPPTSDGPQLHVVRFGKATALASPTVDWRKNCAALFSAAYTPTDFLGSGTKLFGGGLTSFGGTVGRALFFTRRLTDTEVAWLESTLPPLFGLAPTIERFVAPDVVDWQDPPDGDRLTRLNAAAGHPLRSLRIDARFPVSVVVEAVESAGAGVDPQISTAAYVPWYVEWPLDGSSMELPVFPDLGLSGVCKLTLSRAGHYMLAMMTPGGGSVYAHFDVTTE
ncbi:MAG TPA: hypothetical protein VH062_02150 [Polyangiaceae bacterium]|jgi:hypothetical protein|nr:hypothetical protein [Polyangiaceae bacterium]